MPMANEQRAAAQNRGGELYRLALSENRKLTDAEQTELRNLELQLDASEYEMLHGEPPRQPEGSDAQRRFTQGIETRSGERSRILTRETRMADQCRGTYPAEQDGLSLGRLLRGYIVGDWSGAELEQRAMASSPTTAGGINIPTPLSARIIDLARNQAAVWRAGAVTVPMETSTLKMARATSDVTSGWYNEAAAITASDMAFDSVTFTARKLACLVVVNNELLEDAQGVDGAIEESIAKALALKLDLVALTGSGNAPEPRGIQNVVGISTVTGVGTPDDYNEFIDAIYKVRTENFEPSAAIFSPRTAKTLALLKMGTDWLQQLPAPSDWERLTKVVSNQVPVNLGAGTNESLSFVGQFNQLAIGVRKNISIEVARGGAYDVSGTAYSAFQKDQTLIRAIIRADVQVFQPKAFCLMSGITAT